MKRFRKFCQLAPADRRLLFEAIFSLAVTRLILWCVPFRIWSARPAVCFAPRIEGSPTIARLTWAINAASRLVPRTTCLVLALGARRLLASYGYTATVRIGVARNAEQDFTAHAWLEAEGAALPDGAAGPFTPIHSL